MTDRARIHGWGGEVGWEPVLTGATLSGREHRGAWELAGDRLEATAGERAATFALGGADWRSYELAVGVTPLAGGNAQIAFRLDAAGERHYLLDLLLGWQAIAISRVDRSSGGPGLIKLSVVNHALQHGVEYAVELAVREASLTSYVNGQLVNQVTDHELVRGPMALTVWNGRTRFRDPRLRRLA